MVPDPENYTITFTTDNNVNIKADCNMVGGTYTLDGSNLTITLGPSTMAYCGDTSQDTVLLQGLAKVSSYKIEDNSLKLLFADDAGEMVFQNGGAAK